MNIGEKIYTLRTAANMSQGDLAEQLNVSRQSVSKWENNNSTPDVEKLVLIADIFGITVDELVKSETTENTNEEINPTPEQSSITEEKNDHKPVKSAKNIRAAKILLGLGIAVVVGFLVFGLGLAGVFFSIPFFLCSLVCYVAKKDVGFTCAWILVFTADMYVRFSTGSSWAAIKLTSQWTYSMNYWRLLIAWVQFGVILALVIYTIVRARKIVIDITPKFKKELIAYWLGFIILEGGMTLTSNIINYNLTQQQKITEFLAVFNWAFQLIDWLCIFFFAFAVAKTIIYIKNGNKKKGKKDFTNQ